MGAVRLTVMPGVFEALMVAIFATIIFGARAWPLALSLGRSSEPSAPIASRRMRPRRL